MTFEEYNEKKSAIKGAYLALKREIEHEMGLTLAELRRQETGIADRRLEVKHRTRERIESEHAEYQRRINEIEEAWRGDRADRSNAIQAWMARDRDGGLYVYTAEPSYDNKLGVWAAQSNLNTLKISDAMYENVRNGEMVEVRIILRSKV